ncbi:hypothetical protein V1478_012068 [Vespula squamosa]|uniref:Uncharacterized protein n=1 Tax=Vespula squamosa TaxID=30214 RepID=A0ABD2ACW5_VESSQ
MFLIIKNNNAWILNTNKIFCKFIFFNSICAHFINVDLIQCLHKLFPDEFTLFGENLFFII